MAFESFLLSGNKANMQSPSSLPMKSDYCLYDSFGDEEEKSSEEAEDSLIFDIDSVGSHSIASLSLPLKHNTPVIHNIPPLWITSPALSSPHTSHINRDRIKHSLSSPALSSHRILSSKMTKPIPMKSGKSSQRRSKRNQTISRYKLSTQSGPNRVTQILDFQRPVLDLVVESPPKMNTNPMGTNPVSTDQCPGTKLSNHDGHDTSDLYSSSTPSTLCPHKTHCIPHALTGSLQTAATTFALNASWKLVQNVIFGKLITLKRTSNCTTIGIDVSKLKLILFNRESIRLAQFLGLMSFSYKSTLCALRHRFGQNKELKQHIRFHAIAGFIAGFWVICCYPKRQKSLAMNGLIRAIADALKLAVRCETVPVIPGFNMLCFTMSQLVLVNASFWRPQLVHPALQRFFLKVSNTTQSQIEFLRNGVRSKQFVPCCPSLHKEASCFSFNVHQFAISFKRAFIVYVAVHFLSPLLFRPKWVIQNGLKGNKYWKNALRGTIISSVFVSAFNFMVKANVCFFRNLFRADYWWTGIICAVLGSMTLLIEDAKRRPELTLYCIPRAMEILMRCFEKHKWPKMHSFWRSKVLRVLSFQVCIAILMTVRAMPNGIETANKFNMMAMKFIFGEKN